MGERAPTSELVYGFHSTRRLSYQDRVKLPRRLSSPLFLLALSVACPASAGLSATLVYLRSGTAESCPDRAALRQAVARRLGYDPFFGAAPYTVVAEVSGNGSELRARARLLNESGIVLGNRELSGTGTDCAELLASLALAISLTLDPMAATTDPSRELPEVPAVAKEPKPPEPSEPVVIPESKHEPESTRHKPVTTPVETAKDTWLSLQAGLLGSVSWVPALSPAGAAWLAAFAPPLSFGISHRRKGPHE